MSETAATTSTPSFITNLAGERVETPEPGVFRFSYFVNNRHVWARCLDNAEAIARA